MPKYTFEQFGTLEIEPTSIEIKFETLATYPIRNTFDVEILLIVDKAKYLHQFKELPYVGVLTNSEVQAVVSGKLQDYLTN